MTVIHLVRHGMTEAVGRRLCGREAGWSLTAEGRTQAEALKNRFGAQPVAAVYASPLERAQQTATPIARARSLGVRTHEALNEIDFGDWSGCDFDALAILPDWRRWNEARSTFRPPNGEGMAEVQTRMRAFMDEARHAHPEAAIVAVSHADVIKALVCQILGLSTERHAAFEISPGSVTTVVAADSGLKLHSLNEVPHAA